MIEHLNMELLTDQYWITDDRLQQENLLLNLTILKKFLQNPTIRYCILKPNHILTFPRNFIHLTISLENTFQVGFDQYSETLFDYSLHHLQQQLQYIQEFNLLRSETKNVSVTSLLEDSQSLLWTWRTAFKFSKTQLQLFHSIEKTITVGLYMY